MTLGEEKTALTIIMTQHILNYHAHEKHLMETQVNRYFLRNRDKYCHLVSNFENL